MRRSAAAPRPNSPRLRAQVAGPGSAPCVVRVEAHDVLGASGLPFRHYRTALFDIYVAIQADGPDGLGDAPAAREIDQIIAARAEAVRKIASFLDVEPASRMTVVFYPDPESKLLDTGHQGNGWAFGTTLVEVYNETTKVNPYHELTHILAGQIGTPPALFDEGLATYLSYRRLKRPLREEDHRANLAIFADVFGMPVGKVEAA